MSWETVELATVADINPRMPRGLADDLDVSFLPMAAVSEAGQIDYQEEKTVEQVRKGYTYFRRGDVLVAKITPCFENGKATKTDALNAEHGFGSTEFHVIRGNPSELLPEYAFHLVWNPYFRKEATANMTGSAGQKRVPADFLKRLKIPLPRLEEQRRIAGILDAADALRRRRREALALLDTLPGAIFAEMFGDGENLNKAPMKELIEVRSSLADPTLPANADLPHVGPEHILQGGGRIEWGRVQSCHEDGVTSGKYHFSVGDVIYSKIRPYLNKVAIADRSGMCSADMYALRPSSDRMTVRYLHFILGSAEFLAYGNRVSGRANIPKMNRKQLLAFEVPLPTADQQKEFERRLDAIDIERNKHVRQSVEIETLFASLQSRAFAGEL